MNDLAPNANLMMATKPPLTSDDVQYELVKTLEYYFSSKNLAKDEYLVSQMDTDGFVLLDEICKFRKIKQLTNDVEFIKHLIRQSSQLQLDPYTQTKVRSINGLAGGQISVRATSQSIPLSPPQFQYQFPQPLISQPISQQQQQQQQQQLQQQQQHQQHQRCILIMREVNSAATATCISSLFVDKEPLCSPALTCEPAGNDSWYITFENESDAQRALQYLKVEISSFMDKPIKARLKHVGSVANTPVTTPAQQGSPQATLMSATSPLVANQVETFMSPAESPMPLQSNTQLSAQIIQNNNYTYPPQSWSETVVISPAINAKGPAQQWTGPNPNGPINAEAQPQMIPIQFLNHSTAYGQPTAYYQTSTMSNPSYYQGIINTTPMSTIYRGESMKTPPILPTVTASLPKSEIVDDGVTVVTMQPGSTPIYQQQQQQHQSNGITNNMGNNNNNNANANAANMTTMGAAAAYNVYQQYAAAYQSAMYNNAMQMAAHANAAAAVSPSQSLSSSSVNQQSHTVLLHAPIALQPHQLHQQGLAWQNQPQQHAQKNNYQEQIKSPQTPHTQQVSMPSENVNLQKQSATIPIAQQTSVNAIPSHQQLPHQQLQQQSHHSHQQQANQSQQQMPQQSHLHQQSQPSSALPQQQATQQAAQQQPNTNTYISNTPTINHNANPGNSSTHTQKSYPYNKSGYSSHPRRTLPASSASSLTYASRSTTNPPPSSPSLSSTATATPSNTQSSSNQYQPASRFYASNGYNNRSFGSRSANNIHNTYNGNGNGSPSGAYSSQATTTTTSSIASSQNHTNNSTISSSTNGSTKQPNNGPISPANSTASTASSSSSALYPSNLTYSHGLSDNHYQTAPRNHNPNTSYHANSSQHRFAGGPFPPSHNNQHYSNHYSNSHPHNMQHQQQNLVHTRATSSHPAAITDPQAIQQQQQQVQITIQQTNEHTLNSSDMVSFPPLSVKAGSRSNASTSNTNTSQPTLKIETDQRNIDPAIISISLANRSLTKDASLPKANIDLTVQDSLPINKAAHHASGHGTKINPTRPPRNDFNSGQTPLVRKPRSSNAIQATNHLIRKHMGHLSLKEENDTSVSSNQDKPSKETSSSTFSSAPSNSNKIVRTNDTERSSKQELVTSNRLNINKSLSPPTTITSPANSVTTEEDISSSSNAWASNKRLTFAEVVQKTNGNSSSPTHSNSESSNNGLDFNDVADDVQPSQIHESSSKHSISSIAENNGEMSQSEMHLQSPIETSNKSETHLNAIAFNVNNNNNTNVNIVSSTKGSHSVVVSILAAD